LVVDGIECGHQVTTTRTAGCTTAHSAAPSLSRRRARAAATRTRAVSSCEANLPRRSFCVTGLDEVAVRAARGEWERPFPFTATRFRGGSQPTHCRRPADAGNVAVRQGSPAFAPTFLLRCATCVSAGAGRGAPRAGGSPESSREGRCPSLRFPSHSVHCDTSVLARNASEPARRIPVRRIS
jgi:hypothetical protein